jgi:hypothetical protein
MRRTISHTYDYIRRKLKNSGELSMRKQVCLQYLKWGTAKRRDDRMKFVELAIRWRKEERKVGSMHRTVLEKKARRLIPQFKKDKLSIRRAEDARKLGNKTKELQIGVHSPKQVKSKLKNLKSGRGGIPHYWIVYPPNGEPIKIYNLRAFCREHGLRQNHMVATATKPSERKYHQGWRAEKCDPTWDKLHEDG